MIIDAKTQEFYEYLKARRVEQHIKYTAWPELLCNMVAEDGYQAPIEDYRKRCASYDGRLYGEWYRCLAFITYGYGNYSNNERRRKGLPTRRKLRR